VDIPGAVIFSGFARGVYALWIQLGAPDTYRPGRLPQFPEPDDFPSAAIKPHYSASALTPFGGASQDIGALFANAELFEKSSGRLSLAFDDFVEVGPVVAGMPGEFSHAAHLLRHNAEKFDDLRGREAMDCHWGVCHIVDVMLVRGA
jgi:hypothetical protein